MEDRDRAYWTSWSRLQIDAQLVDLLNDLAVVIGLWRQQETLGLEHQPLDVLMGHVIDRWYDAVYVPLMRAGESTCDEGLMALKNYFQMIRHLQLAGVDPKAAYEAFKKRRKPGQANPYAFDVVPPDYVKALAKRCDDEALARCLASGDLYVLVKYLHDREKNLTLAGQAFEDDGWRLLDACARYELKADFTFGEDTTIYYGETKRPLFQMRKQWQVRLTVNLTWGLREVGSPIWDGQLFGEARPAVRSLEWRTRSRETHGSDRGTIDKGWFPWCQLHGKFGTWPKWPVSVTELEFERTQPTTTIEIPDMAIPVLPNFNVWLPARTIKVVGPMQTGAFLFANVRFHDFHTPSMVFTSPCRFNVVTGRDGIAGQVLSTWLLAQSDEMAWEFTEDGLTTQDVRLTEGTLSPFRARREWQQARDVKVQNGDAGVRWDGTITLTHTPRAAAPAPP